MSCYIVSVNRLHTYISVSDYAVLHVAVSAYAAFLVTVSDYAALHVAVSAYAALLVTVRDNAALHVTHTLIFSVLLHIMLHPDSNLCFVLI